MCGVVGKIYRDHPVTEEVYQGLIQLQHRGQDGAGIFAYDPKTGRERLYKNRGLVAEVFNSETLPLPEAPWAIGHVRYSTIGTGRVEDTHPLCAKRRGDTVAIAHNGNIVNYLSLKRELMKRQVIFETTCDAEAILNLLVKELPEGEIAFDALCRGVKELFRCITGAYSVVGMITGKGMFAFRDPRGFRPLLMGRSLDGGKIGFTSETAALQNSGFDAIEDIEPGEVVFVDSSYRVQRKRLTNAPHRHCSFEFNYFAKPNTIMEQKEVYRIRSKLGLALAEKCKEFGVDADVVVPIPDSGRPSAISLAYKLKLPLEEGFVKQNHIGRTFIMPTQYARVKAVAEKLIAVKSVFEGKNVILVDDSIVRGTVSKRVIALARGAGAKSITFASTYPPISHPCLYGIDFPREEQLIANGKSLREIAAEIGAENVIYNDEEGLKEAIGMADLCTACLTGNYPTSMQGQEELQELRKEALFEMEMTCKR